MINARLEMIYEFGDDRLEVSDIKCAWVKCHGKEHLLRLGFTEKEFMTFMEGLDFYYDNTLERRVLFGTIWLKDGSWLDRRWDGIMGTDTWTFFRTPCVPDKLI
jgi:hypothetical protein